MVDCIGFVRKFAGLIGATDAARRRVPGLHFFSTFAQAVVNFAGGIEQWLERSRL